MTNEKLFMAVTNIVRCFSEIEKDKQDIASTAEKMIKDPASWLAEYGKIDYFASASLMKSAAEILLDCVANMNKGNSSDEKKAAAAAKRYYKTAHEEGQRLPALDGVWAADGYYNICDGRRVLRLVKDRPELPKLQYEGQKFNVKAVMDGSVNDAEKVIIEAPDIVSVKTFLAAEKARIKGVKGASVKPYIIKDPAGRPLIGLNPQFIIDALEALPGAVWYGSADNKPVYIVSEDGDSLLLPMVIRNAEEGAAKEDIAKTWDEYKKAAVSVNFTPAAAAAAEEAPQTDSAEAEAGAAPRKRRSRKAAEPQKAEAQKTEGEAPACQQEAAPEDAIITPQKAQEGPQNAQHDIYNACDARSAGRPTKGAKKSIYQSAPAEAATPSGRGRPAPSAATGSASSCDAFPGLRAAGSGAAGPGQERPAAAIRATPPAIRSRSK